MSFDARSPFFSTRIFAVNKERKEKNIFAIKLSAYILSLYLTFLMLHPAQLGMSQFEVQYEWSILELGYAFNASY